MKNFGLYLVLTNPATSYEACAEAAVIAGVRMLQLRVKNKTAAELLPLAKRIRDITRNTETLFIINDDPALAEAAEADGVHLGQTDMPVPEARKRFSRLRCFGLSTHSMEQALAALEQQPDIIGVGPVFATPTKDIPDPVLGVTKAGDMIRATQHAFPAVAIGGIHAGNLADVLKAGAKNFAVVRAVCGAEDPLAAIRELQRGAGFPTREKTNQLRG